MSSVEDFTEVFAFLQSDRNDVRKMAVHGLAQHSKDCKELFAFLSSSTHGPRSIDVLLQYLHVGGMQLLGDILTILINCSADGSCTEMLVTRKIVRKAMRLLDGVENSDHPEALCRGIEELVLMLLSNLTASHISAVDDLLQMGDADLRGFYLGKLMLYYARFAPDGAGGDGDEDGGAAEPTRAPARDLRRWILQILVNITRSSDGQAQLLEDEDWAQALTECLGVADARHRMLAAQCYRNCVFRQEQHAAILRSPCVQVCVERLCDGSECIDENEMLLAEIVAGIMSSDEGMAFLEGINAKKHLQAAIEGNKMHPPTIEFVSRHVLPFIDDVVDAYIVPGSDQVD